MKHLMKILTIISIIVTSYSPNGDSKQTQIVSDSVNINAIPSKVWSIITSKDYAKELGNVFDKKAFVESDWKLCSKVHFKDEPDKIVSTGIIGNLIENELIQVEYDFSGFKYVESMPLSKTV